MTKNNNRHSNFGRGVWKCVEVLVRSHSDRMSENKGTGCPSKWAIFVLLGILPELYFVTLSHWSELNWILCKEQATDSGHLDVFSTRGVQQIWPAYQNLEFWFRFFPENIFKIFSDLAKSNSYYFLFFWFRKTEVRNHKNYMSDFDFWSQKNKKKYEFDFTKSEK